MARYRTHSRINPNMKYPVLAAVALLAACAAAPVPDAGLEQTPRVWTDAAQDQCLQDLNALPAFLLENDTGAKDHLAQKGPFALDAALDAARQKVKKAQEGDSCIGILNNYLKAWRHGHLWVDDVDPKAQESSPAPENKEDSRRPQYKALTPSTALLKLPSFDNRYREGIIALLRQHRKSLQVRPYWIVDVRGNGGGSDSTYEPLLPWIMGNERVEVGAEWLVTPHNIAGQESVCSVMSPGDAECEAFMKRAVDVMRGAPTGSYVLQEGTAGVNYKSEDHPQPRRPLRVAVLIDGGCGSSCEEFLLAVKQSFSVKLVGRRSYGALDYSNLRPFGLPSGQRQLWYATSRSKRLPHLPVDLAGIPPDVFLSEPAGEQGRAEEIQRVQRWLEGGTLAPSP